MNYKIKGDEVMKYDVYFKVDDKVSTIERYLYIYSIGCPDKIYNGKADISNYDLEKFIKNNFSNLGLRLDRHRHMMCRDCYSDVFNEVERINFETKDIFKKWKFHKEIEINNGELYEGNSYNVNGRNYSFEIVFNDTNGKMELRVDYVCEVVINPNNEKIRDFCYKVENKLEEKRRECYRQYLENEKSKNEKQEDTKEVKDVGFLEKIFKMFKK